MKHKIVCSHCDKEFEFEKKDISIVAHLLRAPAMMNTQEKNHMKPSDVPDAEKRPALTDNDDDFEYVAVGPVSYNDQQLFDWVVETSKASMKTASEALQRLVTVNIALLGGSIAFIKPDMMPAYFHVVSNLVFFFSLATAAYGSMPVSYHVLALLPADIAEKKEQALSHRLLFLRCATAFLLVGFALAFVGVCIARL